MASACLIGCSLPRDQGPADDRQISGDAAWKRFQRAADAGDFAAARAAASELTRRFPKNGSAWNSLGWASERAGLEEDARRAYQRAVEANPRHAKAWANLGLSFGKRGDLRGEIACYRRSLKLRPHHAATWQNLAAAAQQAGRKSDLQEAVRHLARLRGPPPRKSLAPPEHEPSAPLIRFPEAAASPNPAPAKEAISQEPASPVLPPKLSENAASPAPATPSAPPAPAAPAAAASPPKAPATVDDFRHALREAPKDPALWNDLGVAQAAGGALEASLESFRQAARLAATQTTPRWNATRAAILLAERGFQEGRSAEGRARLREAVETCPEPDRLRVVLVKLDLAMGDLSAAATDASAMPREGKDAGGAWLALGLALSVHGRDAEAAEALRAATDALPNHPSVWQALGVVQARRHRLAEAAASLERAAQLDPSNGTILYQQGLVEARRKNWRRAASLFRSAARWTPTAEALDAAMAAGERVGAAAAVGQLCREILARDPKNAAAWRVLAQCREREGDLAAAADAWARAAELLPKDADLRNCQGVALARLGRTADARDAFDKGLAVAPEDPLLLGNLALALRRLHLTAESERALDRLRKLDAARAAEIAAWWRAAGRPPRR